MSATTFSILMALGIGVSYFEGSQIKSVDLTAGILSRIRSQLDSGDQTQAKARYKEGMKSTLTALSALRLYTASEIADGRQRILKLLNVDHISSHLTAIGARSFETLGGALYLSNYIFSFVPLEAVSLQDLLKSKGLDLQSLKGLWVWMNHPTGTEGGVGGQLDLTLEAVYHNELIDEFNDLEGKIKQRLSRNAAKARGRWSDLATTRRCCHKHHESYASIGPV